jgi:hypothetical protein
MNKKALINKLNIEMNALPIPDVLNRVREKSNIITAKESVELKATNKKRPFVLKLLPAFMAFVLFAVVLASALMPLNLSYTTLTLDINPSIELTLNTKEEVVKVTAVNDDATNFLQNLNLKGKNYALAIQNILNRAIEQNYITNTGDSAIMLSVATKNQNAKIAFENNVPLLVNNYLIDNSRVATIILEDYEESLIEEYDELKQDFEESVNITPAKYRYIKRVIARIPELEGHEEYLAKMNVGELYKLMNGPLNGAIVDEIINRIINNIPSPFNNQGGWGGIGN